MNRFVPLGFVLVLLMGCSRQVPAQNTLSQARRGFVTHLTRQESGGTPAPAPPQEILRLVKYPAAQGELAAYVSQVPPGGGKHPAIIWITGGDCNSIDDGVWKDAPADNDQTARAFREAGIMTMFPSLRGGNDNPGVKEGFYGEVDDVLAAADFLAKQEGVDPQRIYLGGHSTGGTLALLVAESSRRFRAAFCFGAVDDVSGYGQEYNPYDTSDETEVALRSPGRWLSSIHSMVFLFEGAEQPGNLGALKKMAAQPKNPFVQFFPVAGANHFSILRPTTQLIAKKILADTDSTVHLTFTAKELSRPFTQ